ncbi:MAG: putative peptidoglycan binding domain [Pseudomonadota bacterium]|jgi:peptidoglycan hydrolase-like protein with peptidoglycan-binding domain
MSKFQIRSPLLITAALALTPAIAFAGGDPIRHDGPTTTTTTTTAPSDKSSSSSASSATAIPSEIQETNRAGVAPPAEPAIDASQVQKVFGMDVSLIDLKSLSKEQAKQLQQRLSERGFYRGKVDGVMGPQTKNALSGLMAQQFALNQRLVSQGQITEQFASAMGVDTIGRAPVSGVDTATPSQAPRASEPSPRANEPSPPPPVSEPATRNAAPPSVPPNQ